MQDIEREDHRMSLDSGMIIVIMISLIYMVLVFGLLFYVKNDWYDLLFNNCTVNRFRKTTFIFFGREGWGKIWPGQSSGLPTNTFGPSGVLALPLGGASRK